MTASISDSVIKYRIADGIIDRLAASGTKMAERLYCFRAKKVHIADEVTERLSCFKEKK
jgi:hypothetical protein